MMPIVIIIVLQLIIAGIVTLVLLHLLDRELKKAAIEKLLSVKAGADVKAVYVYYGKLLSLRMEGELKTLVKNRFANSEIKFEHLSSLKGGLIIKIAGEVLDFSISSRLENFWS